MVAQDVVHVGGTSWIGTRTLAPGDKGSARDEYSSSRANGR